MSGAGDRPDQVNEDYFRETYPGRWIEGRAVRDRKSVHRRYQELTLDHLRCEEAGRLLECGCGSGELLARLRARHPDLDLVGLDLGRESLLWARSHALEGSATSLVEGDVTRLPWSTGSFDRVLSSSVSWYVPDVPAAVAEMVRVLKPGGRFVFDVRNPFHVTNVVAKLGLGVRRALGKDVPRYSYLSPAALRRLLDDLPVEYGMRGFFVLLPTRVPFVRPPAGNLAGRSSLLSFGLGRGPSRWLAQKVLVWGRKLDGSA